MTRPFIVSSTVAMRVVFIGAVLALASPAFAFHPLITDDTGTQGQNNVELEIAYQFERDSYRSFDRSRDSILEGTYGPVYTRDYAHELGLTVSYGIIDPLDLVIGVPYGHVRSKESRILYAPPLPPGGYQGLRYKTTGTDTGIGDPVVELKWQFFQRDGLSFAVKPGATLPLGNEDAGFGTGCVSPFLYFILSYENGRFLTHLNFGYIRNQNNQNEREDLWHGSLALEFVLLDDWLRFIVNTGLERNPDTRSNYQDVFVLGGFVFSPSEYCDLDVGFKYSVALAGAESPGPDYAILCGVTVRFDGGAGRAGEDKKEGGK